MKTPREIAQEFFTLIESLRIEAGILRLDKEEEVVSRWEDEIIQSKMSQDFVNYMMRFQKSQDKDGNWIFCDMPLIPDDKEYKFFTLDELFEQHRLGNYKLKENEPV